MGREPIVKSLEIKMTRTVFSTVALAAVLLSGAAQAADRIKFDYWYGLTGKLGEVMQKHCDLFNQSQDKYEAVCTGQGGYDKAEQNTIAAYRAKQHPTVVQIYDAGTVNFMLSGAVVPAVQFAKEHNIPVDWNGYFGGIKNYYATSKGEMWSFPYNSSTAVFYWNKDAWAKIGKTDAPKTWTEYAADLKALKEKGVACGLAYDYDTWQTLEQFSAASDLPIATMNNGYDGLGAELVFNTTAFVDHMRNYKAWTDAGYARLSNDQTGKNIEQAFADGTCASAFSSIANFKTFKETAKGINWAVAMMPVLEGVQRKNTLVGGASLWVMAGKSKEEYEAAAAYLAYVTAPDTGQKFIVDNTGYIPVRNDGQDLLVKAGFYQDPANAGREIAIESLTASNGTPVTRGVRLGNFTSIRKALRSELEAAFSGQKDMQVAIDDAVKAGNDILRRYEQTFKGVQLP
jgi:sn-glycerol 3-phosphate transport system substrate-binding protein